MTAPIIVDPAPMSIETAPRPNAVTLDTVQPERVRWLSRGRIAAGKLTLLEGDPGLGKSTLLCEWAARVSRGEPLPDGEAGAPRGVVLLSAEDGLADTIRPRLEAAGADLARIAALLSIPDGTLEGRPPVIPGDVDAIERLTRAVDAALIIIDPLVAYLDGQLNAYRDQDARRALAALAALADRTGAAILLVRHLTKTSGGPALYRGGGSIGIIGAARCGLLLARDPDDPDLRVLAATKGNLARTPAALLFRLEPLPGSDVAHLRWLGESRRDADELVNPPDSEKRTERDEAKAWLRETLSGGSVAGRKVEEMAKRAGIAPKTLRRAREELGVITRRHGIGEGSLFFWSLPPATATSGASPAHLAHDPDAGQDGQQGQQGQQAWEEREEDRRAQNPPESPDPTLPLPAQPPLLAHVAHLAHVAQHREGGQEARTASPSSHLSSTGSVCLDCGTPLPPGRIYLCKPCADAGLDRAIAARNRPKTVHTPQS